MPSWQAPLVDDGSQPRLRPCGADRYLGSVTGHGGHSLTTTHCGLCCDLGLPRDPTTWNPLRPVRQQPQQQRQQWQQRERLRRPLLAVPPRAFASSPRAQLAASLLAPCLVQPAEREIAPAPVSKSAPVRLLPRPSVWETHQAQMCVSTYPFNAAIRRRARLASKEQPRTPICQW